MDPTIILLYIAVPLLLWLLLIRPQKRRADQQRNMQNALRPGDEILTAGGLVATVLSVDEDENDMLFVELSDGVEARVSRRFVVSLLTAGSSGDADEDDTLETTDEDADPVDAQSSTGDADPVDTGKSTVGDPAKPAGNGTSAEKQSVESPTAAAESSTESTEQTADESTPSAEAQPAASKSTADVKPAPKRKARGRR